MSKAARRRAARRRARRAGVVLDVSGPPCPRCQQLTQVRQHAMLTEKVIKAPFYFARWFRCINPACRVTLIMPPQFKVYREDRQVWDDDASTNGSR
jgi:hypothetical protein